MNVDSQSRWTLGRGIGVVGALAGTTALAAASTSGSVAAAQPVTDDASSSGVTTSATPTADAGVYESCTAMFGLAQKDSASWVQFDVQSNRPISPPVTVGPELQAIVTVHGSAAEADVECEADVPAWSTEDEWLEYVRVQRGVATLDTITGRYPYPGGPGYAIPGVGTTYGPIDTVNLLTENITVTGASVRFLDNSTRFSIVSGSPQDLQNLDWPTGADDARQRVLAIDPDFDATVALCQSLPTTATSEAITAAAAALGSVWGIDVDAQFPPASSSLDDRCLALDEAQGYYFGNATRSLTVGATAAVTIEPPPEPTTTTTSTPTSTTTTAPPDVATADEVTPTFTG